MPSGLPLAALLYGCETSSSAPVSEASDSAESPTDADGDGFVAAVDCDDDDARRHPGALEVCDGLDNDCNGAVDDGIPDPPVWYLDEDGDGFGSGEHLAPTCLWPDADGGGVRDAGATPSSACLAVGAEVGNGDDCDDCDDADPDVRPSARDVCNDARDQDCDGAPRLCPFEGAAAVDGATAVVLGSGLFHQELDAARRVRRRRRR